ncbi:MAG: hypothetical protein PWQ89_682 [Verrucomicrobiota bacterium]|jgi:hypothetical protein|nr:hypothetical protein [Verrucomicrobiota bacterium]
MMNNDRKALEQRTKECALRIIRRYGTLPKTTEAQVPGKKVGFRSGPVTGRASAPGPMLSSSVGWRFVSKRHRKN